MVAVIYMFGYSLTSQLIFKTLKYDRNCVLSAKYGHVSHINQLFTTKVDFGFDTDLYSVCDKNPRSGAGCCISEQPLPLSLLRALMRVRVQSEAVSRLRPIAILTQK